MYDSNDTMREIGAKTCDIITQKGAKEDIIAVIKAHSTSYTADIGEVIHMAIDLYTLGYMRGFEANKGKQSRS